MTSQTSPTTYKNLLWFYFLLMFPAKSGSSFSVFWAIQHYNCSSPHQTLSGNQQQFTHVCILNIHFNAWNIACSKDRLAERMVIRLVDIRGLKLEIIYFRYYTIFPRPVIFTINYSCGFHIDMNHQSIIINSSAN